MNLLIKVVVWRLLSIALTTAITYAFMQDASKSIALTLTTHSVLVISNYIFELVWKNHCALENKS